MRLTAVFLTFLFAAAPASPSVYRFVNGNWLDGSSFRQRVVYSVDGVLESNQPKNVSATTVDLHGGYVLPPFGDAHNHHFDNPSNIAKQVQMYLRDGIFYAMTMTDVRSGSEKPEVKARVNVLNSVDVVYAHGALTGTNSHPIETYESLALGLWTPGEVKDNEGKIMNSRLRANDAYYIVDTAGDLDAKWPMIMAGKPGIIKVFLLHSERYAQTKQGIDPQLLPAIVKKCHDAGLRVAAHVDSPADFRTALSAGVDIMAHMPGYYSGEQEGPRPYLLTHADAAEAARRHVVVIPTVSRDSGYLRPDRLAQIQEAQIPNLNLLKAAGVHFAIGTDSYGTDSQFEALYLSRLGVFSNFELLRIWTGDTLQTNFPGRKIGSLQDGYEASFIVTHENPMDDFKAVQDIAFRFKQGRPIVE
jgi:imidazolonepropionase-like amidohydrolase